MEMPLDTRPLAPSLAAVPDAPLKQTPLHGEHVRLGAKMVDFGGWSMPVQYTGILEEHPRLKLVCPHVGGALPYLIGRMDHQAMVLGRGAEHIRRPPSEYLRGIWLDTVSPLAAAIRYGYDFVGADRLIYASDHPWVDPELIAREVTKLKLPAQDEAKIFSGNARRLFNL